MNPKVLLFATSAGLALQLAMVTLGWKVAPVKAGYLIGGLLFSAVAGALYARFSGGGLTGDILGGLIAGGLCAFLGILVSHLLGDVPAPVLAFGTIGSAVAGAILGGVFHYLR